MQPKHFNLLALAAIISLVTAGFVHSAYNSFNEEVVSGKRLFPSLETQGNKTGVIELQKGEEKLTLKKADDGKTWGIAERGGYPADVTKVRELVIKLGQAELIDAKTRSEKLYDQLDLGDPKKEGTSATLVRLADKGNATIAELVVGKQRRAAFGAGKSGTYVRVPGDEQTWLAKLDADTSLGVSDWVEPGFFAIDANKIKSLTVKQGENVVYRLVPDGAADDKKLRKYKIADVPTGKTTKKGLRIDEMVNGIKTLELTDVRAAGAEDVKPAKTAEIVMESGATYTIARSEQDDKHWLTVVVSNAGDDGKAKEIAASTKGWAYAIPGWRADQTFKTSEDVFETVEAPAEPEALKPPQGLTPIPPTGPRVSQPQAGGAAPATTPPKN